MDDIPEIESSNGVVVRIHNTETALTRQLHRLKRSHLRMMEGLEVINGVSEYIRGEATLLSEATDNLRAQNANGLNPDAGSAAGDVERVTLRPLKRLKKGEENPSDYGRTSDEGESLETYLTRYFNRVKEGLDVICNVADYVYKEECLEVSVDVDERSHIRMMEGLEVINGVSEYMRGEATHPSQATDNLCAQSANGLKSDGGSVAGDLERVTLRPLKRLKKGEENPSDDGRTSDEGESLETYLKRCCNRVKEGLDVICNVAEYVYQEESLKVSSDVDENKKLEEDILEKLRKEGSLEEGMIIFACPVCYPVIEQEEGAEENEDKHIVEAKTVNGVVVNITCTCGTQYQILFTDDSVCIPVPLSTVELNSEVDIPNAIWARKYNGHTEAGLECYYCKREITFDKVGNKLQCYMNCDLHKL